MPDKLDNSENEKYWADRSTEYEEAWYKRCQDTMEKDLAQYYEQALKDIQDDVSALYGRFAKDNKLSMAEAHKLLTGSEYRRWRMSMEEYLNEIMGNDPKGLTRELNTLAMRSRISRLDALYAETLKSLDALGRKTEDRMGDFLSEAYKDRFYHGMYDVAEKAGTMKADVAVDDAAVAKVVGTPWSGKNYSERIWKNNAQLGNVIRTTIENGVHRGLSVPDMSRMVEEKMHAGRYNATRLVRTEMNYVQNRAALDSIKESGLKYFRFIATLDRRTSAQCREHDGRLIPVGEARTGDNVPPLHPNCRSTIAGSLRGYAKPGNTRIARNAAGKNVYVPQGMTYNQWKAVYVDKSATSKGWAITKIKQMIKAKPLHDMDVDRVCKIGEQISNTFGIPQIIGDKGKLKDVFSNFREMGGIIRDDQWGKGSFSKNKQMLRDAFAVYPKAWADFLDKTGKKLYTVKAGRGFFNEQGAVMGNGKYFASKLPNYRGGYVTINMNGVRKTTPFHEIGHYVEFFNPEALRLSKEFIAKRTQNESAERLRDIFHDIRYETWEVTKKDNFISPYIGKEYPNASEVLSMGLEQIFQPTSFLRSVTQNKDGTFSSNYAKITDDKEYLYLILGMLAIV